MISLDANLVSIMYLLDVPNTLSKSKKRWRLAFVVIYCARTMYSLTKNASTKKKVSEIVPIRPYSVFYIFTDDNIFSIHQEILTRFVKMKDLDQLQKLGGVIGVASGIETATEGGICGSAEDIAHRREAFGTNTYQPPPPRSFYSFFVDGYKDLTIIILLVCAALSLGFGIKAHGLKEGWYDGGSIFFAIFLVVTVSAIIWSWESRQLYVLSNVSNNIQIDVVRSGRLQQVSTFELVVGDVVCLKNGDRVPADGLFIDGDSLQVDELFVTGKCEYANVNQSQNPFLFAGTKVVDGRGRMLVTSVGANTKFGEVMSDSHRKTRGQSRLEARLNELCSSIAKAGFLVAFLVLLVLLVRYFTGNTEDENGNREFNGNKTKPYDVLNAVVGIVATTVAIVVVAVPEGMFMAVTMILGYSRRKMMADCIMETKLFACETMGSATAICVDKTGTITMNHMTVVEFCFGKIFNDVDLHPYLLGLVKQGIGLNTAGSVRVTPELEVEVSGTPTEKAILSWAVQQLNLDVEYLKQSCAVIHIEAFNSQKKRSGVLMRRNVDNTIHVHWKGAAELILAMCSSYYHASGRIEPLDDDDARIMFKEFIQGMADKSLRCIAFAHKELSEQHFQYGKEVTDLNQDNLTLLGILGIKDPCRPGVRDAVKICHNAGVKVKMITGDNVFTARCIALETGILEPGQDVINGAVVEGREFRNYTETERMEKVDKICVMARSSPEDKFLMVQCLRRKGHVVAVTGNSADDAPALTEADIGLSMEIWGTEVSKEKSDIVILNDSFASVAKALWWGRCVHDNVQKLIQFSVTVIFVALVINSITEISVGEIPLTPSQFLWASLVMDTLSALALATEQPTDRLMMKPPVCQEKPLITNMMWRNLVAQALYQTSILLALQFKGQSFFGVTKMVNNTMIFNSFILCQVFNVFNARKIEEKNVFRGICRNRWFLGIIVITVVIQGLMVEFLNKFGAKDRLNWSQWAACIAIALPSWPIACVVKCIPVPKKPIFDYFKWEE